MLYACVVCIRNFQASFCAYAAFIDEAPGETP